MRHDIGRQQLRVCCKLLRVAILLIAFVICLKIIVSVPGQDIPFKATIPSILYCQFRQTLFLKALGSHCHAMQAQKLNSDCLALKPPQEETDRMQADIKRICREAMALPGELVATGRKESGSFDLDAEISDAMHDKSGSYKTASR